MDRRLARAPKATPVLALALQLGAGTATAQDTTPPTPIRWTARRYWRGLYRARELVMIRVPAERKQRVRPGARCREVPGDQSHRPASRGSPGWNHLVVASPRPVTADAADLCCCL